MKKITHPRADRLTLRASLVATLAAFALAGCGGGDSSGDNFTESSPPATSLSGTVATGTALPGAIIAVTDAGGKTVSATSGPDGSYSVQISGLTAPLLITVSNPFGPFPTLYSVVATTDTADGDAITANVTPLTTAISALLTASGNPRDLQSSGGAAEVTPDAVASAVGKLGQALAPILAQYQLTAASFDPIATPFTANHTGVDGVIDSVSVTPAPTGLGLQISSIAAPDTAIALNAETSVSMPLAAPLQLADYLSGLISQFRQCIAGSSDACSSAIDANYLSSSYATMQTRFPGLFASGSTFLGVKTVKFLPAGTLSRLGNPAALVYFQYVDSTGATKVAPEIVQQLPGGNWNIIGNQAHADINVASFVGRMQFTNPEDVDHARLESGLDIKINADITHDRAGYDPMDPPATQLASALVQGPGLPSDGLYMASSHSGISDYLVIPSVPVHAPVNYFVPNGDYPRAFPDRTMSWQYKWDWASLDGRSSSWSPAGDIDYTQQRGNIANTPQHGVYTVTLYNYYGQQIGQPEQVLNVAPNLSAASGAAVPWQTLDSDSIANILTPGGSATDVRGTNNPTAVDWKIPATNPIYANLWVAINSVSFQPYKFSLTTDPDFTKSDPNNSSIDKATPSITASTYSVIFKEFVNVLAPIASAEKASQVEFGWQSGGAIYTNAWQYNNHNYQP